MVLLLTEPSYVDSGPFVIRKSEAVGTIQKSRETTQFYFKKA